MEYKPRMSTYYMVLCALFAALSAVVSPISVPIPFSPVAINMVHVSIFCAVGLLGAKYGTLSQIVFVLIGVAGLPVFTGFRGGPGVLVDFTGGFIIGNVLCALAAGLIIDKFGRSVKVLVIAMCTGYIFTYLLGVSWYMHWVNNLSGAMPEDPMTFTRALPIVMLPFLPGEVFKVVISVILIRKLYPVMQRRVHQ